MSTSRHILSLDEEREEDDKSEGPELHLSQSQRFLPLDIQREILPEDIKKAQESICIGRPIKDNEFFHKRLTEAISTGNLPTIKLLLDSSNDLKPNRIFATNEDKLFNLAIKKGQLKSAHLLLQMGYQPTQERLRPILWVLSAISPDEANAAEKNFPNPPITDTEPFHKLLIKAIEDGDLVAVFILSKHFNNPDSIKKDKLNPVAFALANNQIKIALLLLQMGCKASSHEVENVINEIRVPAVQTREENNAKLGTLFTHSDEFELLIDELQRKKNINGKISDSWFQRAEKSDLVRLPFATQQDLLQRDTNGNTPIHYACLANNLDSLKIIFATHPDIDINNIKNNKGLTPLAFAVYHNRIAVAKYLIEQCYANVTSSDENGNTPLHHADSPEMVKLLIVYGANVDMPNTKGDTPFSFNFLKKRKNKSVQAILKLLIQQKADLNMGSEIPLLNAIQNNLLDEVRNLLVNGANVLVKDPITENTALHYAGTPEMANLLYKNGAEIDAPGHDGYTPLNYAETRVMKAWFTDHGAKIHNCKSKHSLLYRASVTEFRSLINVIHLVQLGNTVSSIQLDRVVDKFLSQPKDSNFERDASICTFLMAQLFLNNNKNYLTQSKIRKKLKKISALSPAPYNILIRAILKTANGQYKKAKILLDEALALGNEKQKQFSNLIIAKVTLKKSLGKLNSPESYLTVARHYAFAKDYDGHENLAMLVFNLNKKIPEDVLSIEQRKYSQQLETEFNYAEKLKLYEKAYSLEVTLGNSLLEELRHCQSEYEMLANNDVIKKIDFAIQDLDAMRHPAKRSLASSNKNVLIRALTSSNESKKLKLAEKIRLLNEKISGNNERKMDLLFKIANLERLSYFSFGKLTILSRDKLKVLEKEKWQQYTNFASVKKTVCEMLGWISPNVTLWAATHLKVANLIYDNYSFLNPSALDKIKWLERALFHAQKAVENTFKRQIKQEAENFIRHIKCMLDSEPLYHYQQAVTMYEQNLKNKKSNDQQQLKSCMNHLEKAITLEKVASDPDWLQTEATTLLAKLSLTQRNQTLAESTEKATSLAVFSFLGKTHSVPCQTASVLTIEYKK